MVMGYRVAERSKAGGEVIELAVARGDNFAQPGDLAERSSSLRSWPVTVRATCVSSW